MIYIFDSSVFIHLFRYYYPEGFPSLWERFNQLVNQNTIISVKEVARELSEGNDNLVEWAKDHGLIFQAPDADELQFVASIFQIRHFQSIIRNQERLEGRPVADPFVIAKAWKVKGWVISMEIYKENSAKMPNICKHYRVPHLDFRDFMKKENWTF